MKYNNPKEAVVLPVPAKEPVEFTPILTVEIPIRLSFIFATYTLDWSEILTEVDIPLVETPIEEPPFKL